MSALMPSQGTPKQPIRLAVFLSGSGSNFEALAQAIDTREIANAQIALVVSNKPQAYGLIRAEQRGISRLVMNPKAFSTPEAFDTELVQHLKTLEIDVIVLAGYLKILTPMLIQPYKNRILNIHPSLLPAYGGKGMYGLNVHQAVIENQETQSGCTVHLVSEGIDEGPILAQSVVTVLPQDTPESLAERVLAAEHVLLPQTLKGYLTGAFPEFYSSPDFYASPDFYSAPSPALAEDALHL
jgi:phosphoribosylglycinamide formyltransferase 1